MSSTITIIDYGSGNLHSIHKAFEHVAKDERIVVSSDIHDVKSCDKIVLPGVGAFGDCVDGLSNIDGLADVLGERVLEGNTPFLGVCVGMQMLADQGEEHGIHQGLGWIKGHVVAIEDKGFPIPHMGWNSLQLASTDHPILNGISSGDHAYFVHSYHFVCEDKERVLATVDYGHSLNAIVAKDNICATQFHPEKSQRTGLTLIRNFMDWS